MTDVKRLRPDWEIARMLAKDGGLRLGQEWMRSVLIDLRDSPEQTIGEFDMGLWTRVPWRDAVFLYDYSFANVVGESYLAATRVVERAPKVVVTATFLRVDEGAGLEWLPVGQCIVDNTEHTSVRVLDGVGEYEDGHVLQLSIGGVSVCLKYLAECDAHRVEVRSEPQARDEKQMRRYRKTVQNFPWLNEDLPRIVLLDPHRHYPGHGRDEPDGTHASPMPHQRRGHWATLRAERWSPEKRGTKVWRRPAWVGDREWIHHGSVYRVLDEEPKP